MVSSRRSREGRHTSRTTLSQRAARRWPHRASRDRAATVCTVPCGAAKPRRVLVVGPPGVGKTWVSQRLATAYALPHVELDAFKLMPHRRLASAQDFKTSIEAVLERNLWLLDGNWSDDDIAKHAWCSADLVVWLDYPRHVVIRQVVWRTLRRWASRQEYYGWTERMRDWVSPTHPVRWSWTMVAVYSLRYEAMASRLTPGRWVRLSSRSDAHSFVAAAQRS